MYRWTRRTISRLMLLVVFAFGSVFLSFTLVSRYAVGVHQRAVASEIDGWANEYAVILNDADAIRSAEMLDYIAGYYLPYDGYRSFVSSENILLQSRRRAVDRIVAALYSYTGLEFGHDIAAWSEWSNTKRTDAANTR